MPEIHDFAANVDKLDQIEYENNPTFHFLVLPSRSELAELSTTTPDELTTRDDTEVVQRGGRHVFTRSIHLEKPHTMAVDVTRLTRLVGTVLGRPVDSPPLFQVGRTKATEWTQVFHESEAVRGISLQTMTANGDLTSVGMRLPTNETTVAAGGVFSSEEQVGWSIRVGPRVVGPELSAPCTEISIQIALSEGDRVKANRLAGAFALLVDRSMERLEEQLTEDGWRLDASDGRLYDRVVKLPDAVSRDIAERVAMIHERLIVNPTAEIDELMNDDAVNANRPDNLSRVSYPEPYADGQPFALSSTTGDVESHFPDPGSQPPELGLSDLR
jgi:hypothetical protein